MIGVSVQLKGEEAPRPCLWDSSDLAQLADLDEAVGGLENLDHSRLWHVIALYWVTCGRDMPLREFASRLPWGGDAKERMRKLVEGARLLWQQIT